MGEGKENNELGAILGIIQKSLATLISKTDKISGQQVELSQNVAVYITKTDSKIGILSKDMSEMSLKCSNLPCRDHSSRIRYIEEYKKDQKLKTIEFEKKIDAGKDVIFDLKGRIKDTESKNEEQEGRYKSLKMWFFIVSSTAAGGLIISLATGVLKIN